MNYYPAGAGIGMHSDDEFLFDGMRRYTTIVSLSLCADGGGTGGGSGSRLFQVDLNRKQLPGLAGLLLDKDY